MTLRTRGEVVWFVRHYCDELGFRILVSPPREPYTNEYIGLSAHTVKGQRTITLYTKLPIDSKYMRNYARQARASLDVPAAIRGRFKQ